MQKCVLFFVGETSPCYPNPCNGGGTCEEHDNTYTCFCSGDRTGDRCERRLSENDVRVPMFSTNSLVELLPMENVEHKVSIEIDFKANSLQGKPQLLFGESEQRTGVSGIRTPGFWRRLLWLFDAQWLNQNTCSAWNNASFGMRKAQHFGEKSLWMSHRLFPAKNKCQISAKWYMT